LFSLLFYPEDGGDVFLRYVGLLSPDNTALYPRRQKSILYVKKKRKDYPCNRPWRPIVL
jgi:hypothetical protein